jgi:hypothetical protein
MERHISSRIHQTPSRRYTYVPRFAAVRPLFAPARAQVMRMLEGAHPLPLLPTVVDTPDAAHYC